MVRVLVGVLTVLLLLSAPGFAASFLFVPVRIYINPRTRSTVLTITNTSDKKATLQLALSRWSQDEKGKFVLTPSKDILFFPKLLALKPGQKRVVRLAYRGKRKLPVEKTYRLVVTELPVDEPSQEVTLKLLLSFSLPVFIQPADMDKDVSWNISKGGIESGKITLEIRNRSVTHFLVRELGVIGLDGGGAEIYSKLDRGWYVLADSKAPFEIKLGITREQCLRSRRIKLTAIIVSALKGPKIKETEFQVKPSAAQCPETKKEQQEKPPKEQEASKPQ